MSNKVMLIILDGWGLSPSETGNAPLLAKTPVLDYVYNTYPKTSVSASGLEVGLGAGEPGNSEVGHLNIGSGRVVWENLPRIDQSIESGEFEANEVLNNTFKHVLDNNSVLHLIGLVSGGGVHSHIRHLAKIVELAAKNNIKNVVIHFISDGRDTGPKEAPEFAIEIEGVCKRLGVGHVATLIGRYFAMDRDKNWDREKKAMDLFLENTGEKFSTLKEAIEANYSKDKLDEFIEPAVIGEGGKISANDGIILFNHRSDRMRQTLDLLYGAEGTKIPENLFITTMTEYSKEQKAPAMFKPVDRSNTLSDVIANNGSKQYHTAETEKFAHVTYFFKAGNETILKNEEEVIVPSKKVPTYDQLPEMSAPEVKEKVLSAIKDNFDFIVVNFANGDMVGHTGILNAAIEACEDVDKCLLGVFDTASKAGYKVILTADHGNCEVMIDETTGTPNKEHTTNPVPFVYLDFTKIPFSFVETLYSQEEYQMYAIGTPIGVLADIAPSILANLQLSQPLEMSGMDLSIAMQ